MRDKFNGPGACAVSPPGLARRDENLGGSPRAPPDLATPRGSLRRPPNTTPPARLLLPMYSLLLPPPPAARPAKPDRAGARRVNFTPEATAAALFLELSPRVLAAGWCWWVKAGLA